MKSFLRPSVFSSFVFLALGGGAFAANTPTLSSLTQNESDAIMKNFGNAVAFRSLEPPSSNGKIWGLGFGLVGQATSATHVNEALATHGTPQNIPALPAGDLVVSLQGPKGVSLELGFLPSKTISGFTVKRLAFNAKWTFTDVLLRKQTPFDAAFRFGYGRNEFAYNQVLSGVQDRVEFVSKALRLELAASRKFLFLEPYLGLGMLRTSSTLSNTASQALFNFTASETYDFSKSSFFVNLGTEILVIPFVLAGQVEWAFGETTAALKIGFKF